MYVCMYVYIYMHAHIHLHIHRMIYRHQTSSSRPTHTHTHTKWAPMAGKKPAKRQRGTGELAEIHRDERWGQGISLLMMSLQ